MEYVQVGDDRVPVPQVVINEGDPDAYVAAADDAARSVILGPLQTEEAERLQAIVAAEIEVKATIEAGETPSVELLEAAVRVTIETGEDT